MAARRGGFRSSYGRWDRREVGLKPENALSRVAQLVEVGEVADANQALYDIITDTQPRRRQWSKTYEGIMLKLMELSVELREPGMVKEALHKYRAMCMQSNVASLEEVVRFLIDLAEKRTEAARKQVDETILEGAQDLEEDAMETPETLILEAAGNALTKERIDRQQVVPWMRFLWEAYRVVLDIVKTHSKLELCYHSMANRAFAFCVKYKRFMEFRRLCDMLRQHLSQLMNNTRNSPNDVKITDPETLQKFMETRFTQLSTAVTLEHWQEGYRTIEDIHMIITMGHGKMKAKPQHMSIYYDKLMQVFWVSGNYLYHAHALYKLYTLSVKQNRNLSAEDAQNMASRLMLAALSIPVYDAPSAMLSDSYGVMTDVLGTPTNENAQRHARMASLLGYSSAAERRTLIIELLSKGVGSACHSELHDLHDLFEGEMAPLQFAERFKKILDFVEQHEVLKEYTVPVRRVGIFRLLEQLGRVYDVMRLDDMMTVASFTNYREVEETALIALKTRSLGVRFDYQNQCLRFESELFSTDGMRSQLGRLAKRMALTSKLLTEKALLSGVTASDQEVISQSLEAKKRASIRRQAAMKNAKASAADEEKAILQRRDIIERRKEEAERRTAEAVRQRKLAAARELANVEARRKEEARRRYDEQVRRAQVSAEAAGAAAPSVRTGGVIGADDGENEAEREERMTREKEKELKEQAEARRRVLQLAGHLNHIERANREEQWELLKEEHVKEVVRQSQLTEELAVKELEEAKAMHARALEDKERAARFMPQLQGYLKGLMERVDEDFELWAEKERERAEEQARREEEAARLRKEEEERERLEKEELERIELEEAERVERAEREAHEAREAEERAREEREAAARAEEERRKAAAAAAAATPTPYKPGAYSRLRGRTGGGDSMPIPTPASGSGGAFGSLDRVSPAPLGVAAASVRTDDPRPPSGSFGRERPSGGGVGSDRPPPVRVPGRELSGLVSRDDRDRMTRSGFVGREERDRLPKREEREGRPAPPARGAPIENRGRDELWRARPEAGGAAGTGAGAGGAGAGRGLRPGKYIPMHLRERAAGGSVVTANSGPGAGAAPGAGGFGSGGAREGNADGGEERRAPRKLFNSKLRKPAPGP